MNILQKYIEKENKYYCPYCGKELEVKEEWEDYELYTYRFCNCDDAKEERRIMCEIRNLEKQLPKPKYEVKPEIVEIKK